jgi:O-acetylhomoserine (thiol)-lyase
MELPEEINAEATIRWVMATPTLEEAGESRPMRVAVVGLSESPDRPSYRVSRAMQRMGYRIIPVNPTATEILGERVYPSLAALPEPVDVVQVFRQPQHLPGVVADLKAMAVKPKVLWFQEGVIHEAAAQEALDWGVAVVMDRCTYKEALRLQNR